MKDEMSWSRPVTTNTARGVRSNLMMMMVLELQAAQELGQAAKESNEAGQDDGSHQALKRESVRQGMMESLAYHDDMRIPFEMEQHGRLLQLVIVGDVEQVWRLLFLIPVVGEIVDLQVFLVVLLHGGGIIELRSDCGLHLVRGLGSVQVFHLAQGLTGVVLAALEKSLEIPGLIAAIGLGGLLRQPGFAPIYYDTKKGIVQGVRGRGH